MRSSSLDDVASNTSLKIFVRPYTASSVGSTYTGAAERESNEPTRRDNASRVNPDNLVTALSHTPDVDYDVIDTYIK